MPYQIIWVGVFMMVGTLVMFSWALDTRSGLPEEEQLRGARTLVFYTLTMFQMFNVLAIRVERESVFKAGFFKNRFLIAAVLSTILLQLIVIYVPFFQGAFETISLSWIELVLATLVASSLFFAVELEKFISRRIDAQKVGA